MQTILNAAESWFQMNIGEAGLYTVIGFVFVFLGIAILVLVFTLIGMIMKRVSPKKEEKPAAQPAAPAGPAVQATQGVDMATVAVITAAIAAYYESNHSGCDFVVRRIKKL